MTKATTARLLLLAAAAAFAAILVLEPSAGPAVAQLGGASGKTGAPSDDDVTAMTGVQDPAWVDFALHWITRTIEFGGIAVIVIGAVSSTVAYLRSRLAGEGGDEPYHEYRASLGRSILLGLEFLVAADIIATVAIEPTLRSVVVLGGIVLIRTFLSFALEVEIEGRWPWQNARDAPKTHQKKPRPEGDGA